MSSRGFIVWGVGIAVVLGLFLIFVAAGWPGKADSCIAATPNTCFCEAFNPADVASGAGGVRQPVNTWVNLYSILTSLLVAAYVFADRKADRTENPMRAHAWIPDLYIFAVLFLGLGSMWFHASLKEWGGVFDQMSMFVYAAFLVFYSIYRFWENDWFFAIGYGLTVVAFTLTAAIWTFEHTSLILILILVALYLIFETVNCVKQEKFMMGRTLTIALWIAAVVAIGLATLFWALSQTGGVMCNPSSAVQPHGMLWHPLAGVMAVLLYFYWRAENAA